MALLFEDAAKAKEAIMASQQEEIKKLYDQWADDVLDKAIYYSHKTNASAALSERYYKELFKQMNAQCNEVGKEVQGIIKGNIYTIADSVVKSNVNWLKEFGFSEDGLNAAFSHIPHDVVQRLVTGQIYQGGWNLSQRIWSDSQQTQKDIYQVMARGLAEQKSVYEIAKDLESYVRPGAKLPWNPVLAMKNTKTGKIEYKRIYKKQVDYNAQRLARTLAQHSYQQSFIATTQKNPFITEYIWHSNGSRVCPLCLDRDGMHFKKDALPMDHPNGMCTMEPAVAEDMVDQLADWFNSPDGTYPEIDEFAGNFGYEASKSGTLENYLSKYGKSDKSWGAYVKSLSPIQKAEAQLLKEKEGLSWQKWYEKNIYTGTGSSAPVKKAVSKVDDAISVFKGKYATKDKFQEVATKAYYGDKTAAKEVETFLKLNGVKPTDFKNYQDVFGDFDYGKFNSMMDDFYNGGTKVAAGFADDAAMFAKPTSTIPPVGTNPVSLSTWDDMIVSQRDRNFLSKMRGLEDEWEAGLTQAQKRAVHQYTKEGSNCYRQQNGYLRFGEAVSDEVKRTVEHIHDAIEKSVTTEDMMLVRGTSTRLYTDIFKGNLKTALDTKNVAAMAGEVFRDPGFLSTSPNGDEFSGNLKFKIYAPAGTKGGYVEKNNYFGEREFLLQNNTAYYVEKAEMDGNDILMYLRVLVEK